MHKNNSLFLLGVLFALFLVACEGQPTQVSTAATREPPTVVPPTLPPTQVPPTQAPPLATATRVESTPTPTAAQGSRTATIKEILNKVDARTSVAAAFLEARLGLGLNVGGQVRTGDSSKTRLDFSEGTIVRLGQNTVLTVEELTTSSGNPLTRFQFEVGKLWISLFGGTMEIKTPVGLATVRGSYAVIECTPPPARCTFDVIEGIGQFGGLNMKDLERVVLLLNGGGMHSFLDPSDVFDFCQNNPEVCDPLKRALDAGSPEWRASLVLAPPLMRGSEPEPGPAPIPTPCPIVISVARFC